MPNTYSKIELLYLINELSECGDTENAMRLQKIFLESLAEDRESGRYTFEVQLDRKGKKALIGAKTAIRNLT